MRELSQTLIDGKEPIDMIDLNDIATKSGLLAEFQSRGHAGASAADMFNTVFAPGKIEVLGAITIAETAAVAIAAGVRRVTIALPAAWGVQPGDNLLMFPTSFPTNGYATYDVMVAGPNTISVGLTAPALAVGASYSFGARLMRVGI